MNGMALARILPDDIVAADASYSSMWVASYLTATRPGQRFLLPRGLAGLGWGLPLAMGAKLARPDARVVCLVGDGGFAHVWAELETAVREDLPVVVVVLNNTLLGMQRHGENLAFGETSTAIGFAPVDHATIARASGAAGLTVDDPAKLAPALRDALDSERTTVIDVLTDPDSFAPLRIFDGMHEQLNPVR
jgi:acetolactate synthase I/II/III large subunit